MLHRFAFVVALWLTAWPVPGAPTAGNRSRKATATDEKKKQPVMDTHTVRRGETLWGIARLHGVSVGDIMDLNRLGDSSLRDGQVLKIPSLGSDPALVPATPTTHVVSKGETFRDIARKYGLTQEDLERANPKADPAAPRAGSKLTIPAAMSTGEDGGADAPASKPLETIHTVTEDDTYTSIAKKYGVTERAIAGANPDVNPNRLRPGSKLHIPQHPADERKDDGGGASAAAKTGLVTATAGRSGAIPDDAAGSARSPAGEKTRLKTRRYVVSDDETPQTISEAFNITVGKLYEINGMKPGAPMKTGMEIQVPSSPGAAP